MDGRTLILLAILVCEGLALGITYDAKLLKSLHQGWWSAAWNIIGRTMPVALSIATVGLLIAAPRINDRLRHLYSIPWSGRRSLFLAAHFAAFCAFFALSDPIFDAAGSVQRNPGSWAAAWLFLAVATVALWAAAVLPPGALRMLAREGWPVVLAAVACGWLAWFVGRQTQDWWGPLRHLTFAASAALLKLVDSSTWSDAAAMLIGAGDFIVEISPECSGYEGIGLLWISLSAWVWCTRERVRFPHILLLFAAGTLAVWCANVLRIAALVLIGAHWSPNIAAGGFHSYAGALLFSGVILASAWAANRSAFFVRGPDAPSGLVNPAAPYLLPILAVTLAGLAAALVSQGPVDVLSPMRILVAAAMFWHFREHYRQMWSRASVISVVAGVMVFAIGLVSGSTGHVLEGLDTDSLQSRWLAVVVRCVDFVLVAPLVQELAFRGYLARRLMSVDFDTVRARDLSWWAIVISAVLFGALHRHVIAGIAAGFFYGWVARSSGRLADAIWAHTITNALLVVWLLATVN